VQTCISDTCELSVRGISCNCDVSDETDKRKLYCAGVQHCMLYLERVPGATADCNEAK
jgi:hypothetical protein